MEVALHQAYTQSGLPDERKDFKLFHEYPLGGKPPMMTHIFQDGAGNRIVAAKGAPEALMAVSDLSEAEKQNIEAAMQEITGSGFRVLGVGEADPIANGFAGDAFPEEQQSLSFRFLGLVAFYDPPKANIPEVLQDFYQAGIAVKIITGDNALTTATIARQVGFEGPEKSISGEELMLLDDAELEAMVGDTNVFSRMFPEAKLRIVNALKAKGEIVAMTGDGVNDGPALKAAHIGVAMGKRGTEIAKQAASLVLVDDDLARMVDAIAMGRKIYSNLKKAIQYIISIHIPIILTVFLPLAFGWIYPDIFSPVHVIMLELIMGPTCSIVYQNEPAEKNTMLNKPRSATNAFFNWHELNTSIVQGLVITVGVLAMYLFAVDQGYGETLTRSMVFATLVFSNIFLTLINRSFYYSILTTARYKNQLIPLIIGITALILGALIYVPPLAWFFEFEALNVSQLALCMGTGFLFVAWYEVVKWRKRQRKQA
jgi:Ca2+-transporting ATPase